MSTIKQIVIGAAATAVLLPGLAMADAASDVIALTKAQWAAQMQRASTADMMKDVADDYTEFNPGTPVRIDGKAMATRLADADVQAAGELVAAEMANEHVQVYGDTAILTYNFIGKAKTPEGTIEDFFAKSTRVYVKDGGSWKLVHANFGALDMGGN